MKKGAVFLIAFLVISITLTGVLTSASESESVSKAYTCVKDVIQNKTCEKLSTEEKIFSLLSVGKCKSELLNDAYNEICWPKEGCTAEMTSKAILALDKVGVNVDKPVKWLQEQKEVTPDLDWYLEVDSDSALSCSAGYENPNSGSSSSYNEYPFSIGEDKLISQSAGSCLTLSNKGYWFKIDPSCYKNLFTISCNETFISTLVYQEKGSSTYHISENVHGSTGGTTTEKIDSYCLPVANGGSCDYLGTLWGSTVLSILNKNSTGFLPYLITTSSKFPKTFPEVFLYILTGNLDYKTSILNKQINGNEGKYWSVPTGKGKYYDTALALWPFQGINLQQKTDSKDWLFKVQNNNGCWNNNNIVSNGFLLYSLWPNGESSGGGGGGESLCTDFSSSGYECVNETTGCSAGTQKTSDLCGDGQICCAPIDNGLTECENQGGSCLFASQCTGETNNLNCGEGSLVCCTSSTPQPTCSDKNGVVCSSSQTCSGGNELLTNDLNYGEVCCVGGGTCITPSNDQSANCEANSGYCSSTLCDSGYEQSSSYTCPTSGDICCIQSSNPSPSSTSYWWLWVLFILIILVGLGIFYKQKIKDFINKMKARRSGKGSFGNSHNGPRGPPPRFPPSYERRPQMSPPPRRIAPPPRRISPHQRYNQKQRSPKELDEVLKKLKEIGK